MKLKILFSLLFSLLFSFSLSAQHLYLNIGSGYGINIGGSPIATYSTTYNITVDTSTQYNDYFSNKTSLGKGFVPAIGLGYKLHKSIFLELNASFLYGKSISIKNTDQYNLPYGYSSAVITTRSYSGQSLMITPSIMLRTQKEKANYYVKMGLLLGSTVIYQEGNHRIYDAFSGPNSPFTTVVQRWQYYLGLSYGIDISAGIAFPFILDNLDFFAELGYLNYSAKPKKAKTIAYTVDGEDKHWELTTKE